MTCHLHSGCTCLATHASLRCLNYAHAPAALCAGLKDTITTLCCITMAFTSGLLTLSSIALIHVSRQQRRRSWVGEREEEELGRSWGKIVALQELGDGRQTGRRRSNSGAVLGPQQLQPVTQIQQRGGEERAGSEGRRRGSGSSGSNRQEGSGGSRRGSMSILGDRGKERASGLLTPIPEDRGRYLDGGEEADDEGEGRSRGSGGGRKGMIRSGVVGY